MSCGNQKYLIERIYIEGDPIPGPPGPPGKPGAFPDTYPADQVTVTNDGFNNAQEIFDYLLYVAVDITSFSCSNGTTFEEGRELTSLTFNWAINKTIESQTLTGPAEMTPVTLTPEQRSVTVTLSNLSDDSTFTLTVDDGTQTDQANVNIRFTTANYRGDALEPVTIDETFIKSLGTKWLDTDRKSSYQTDAVGSQYNWYCYPTSYGVATFYAGGFEGGYSNVAVVSVTNDYGHTEDYYVWRSDNPGIGPNLNINVT